MDTAVSAPVIGVRPSNWIGDGCGKTYWGITVVRKRADGYPRDEVERVQLPKQTGRRPDKPLYCLWMRFQSSGVVGVPSSVSYMNAPENSFTMLGLMILV